MTSLAPPPTTFSGSETPIDPALRGMIIVPCYNEANRLDADAFMASLDALPGVRFLFVDDGSTDKTLIHLKALKRRAPGRISILALAQNGGKAEAVRQGMLAATDCGAPFVGFWDADLATPLHAIFDMLRVGERFGDVDVIFGSRRRMIGHRIHRNISRRIVSRICNLMARMALGMPIGDTQCGAKLLRNTETLQMALARPFSAGWLFDVELFARIAVRTERRDAAFYEMPLSEWQEIPGSNVSARVVLRAGFQMLRLIAETRLRALARI